MSLNKLSDAAELRAASLISEVTPVIYKHEREPQSTPAEFIVVNVFNVSVGPMQKFVLNVNCHAKNLSGSVPDFGKIRTMSQAVLDILEDYSTTDLLIDYEGGEIFSEPSLDEHYYNLRFSLKFINY